jgi:PTH1 family peptidyl-tRNA hydrolase
VSNLRLIVGLGNPGPRYQGTRHNVGFELADRVARRLGASFAPWKDLGWLAEAEHPREGRLFLAKPGTYMNLSGRMVGPLVRYRNIDPDSVLAVYDDIALPAGQVRLRLRGSSGGHKGMLSILEALGTEEIPRLRVGVGPIPAGADAAEFVLCRPTPGERAAVAEGVERAEQALMAALTEGLDSAMTLYNAKASTRGPQSGGSIK